jgi:hypothetical protein
MNKWDLPEEDNFIYLSEEDEINAMLQEEE